MIESRLTSPPRPLVLGGRPLTAVGRLRMYVCGITPYGVTHVGHAATYVWADAAERVLRWQGHQVTVARNITDVDDALEAEAGRRGADPSMLAAVERAGFDATMARLRVRTPDHQPSATSATRSVVQLAAALLTRGAAYRRGGSVYARTSGARSLAGIDEPHALALAAEYHDHPDDPDRDHPLDVVVWRAARDDEIGWPSPWGRGRPGWHAECAAMVLSLFGATVDLHAGGADLAYPHHACESVMAEAATGVTPFARAWLRAGIVRVGGAKMAKSTGNLVLVDDLLRDHSPAALRLLLLNRAPDAAWDFEIGDLDAAAGVLDDLYAAAARPGGDAPGGCEPLLDGLDVPAALANALDRGGACAREFVEVLALR